MVTWNAAAMLPSCLESLLAQRVDGCELVVVDNASSDGSVAVVEKTWPAARVLREASNLGFAAAADKGIEASSGEHVCLLNYDVRLGDNYLARCVAALDDDAGLGSVQGLLVRPGGAVVDSAGHIAGRARWFRNRGQDQPVGSRRWAPAEVFGVTAAAAVYRRAMLDDVRGVTGHVFDPHFFAYLEDVDLDWRARWRGWRSMVVEGAVAEHDRSGSGGRRRAWVQRHIVKNRLLVIFRNEDRAAIASNLPWIAAAVLGRLGLALATAPSSLLGVVDAWRLRPLEAGARDAIRKARKVDATAARAWFRG